MTNQPSLKAGSGRPSAILWDLDGVLIDSFLPHFHSWASVLLEHGVCLSPQQFEALFGLSNQETLRRLLGPDFPAEEAARLGQEKELRFRRGLPGTAVLLPGVLEWLKEFTLAGIPQAVASSGLQENVDAALEATRIRDFFRVVISSGVHPPKPDPWVFLEAARLLGVDPALAVVIEDSPHGVEAARRAGIWCVAISPPGRPISSLAADQVLDSLEDLNWDALSRGLP